MFTRLSVLIIASANAGAGSFNYLKQGADWNDNTNWVCGSGKQQSPIDFSGAQTKPSSEMFLSGRGYTNSP